MSYQVLARKWRPRTFETLVGQEHVVKALTHALDQNRLHHAYLFTGTRGVGKTTIARILAKALNCETGVTSKPCGVCSACTEIDSGRFVDLIEIDAATNTGIDDMRDLQDNAIYAPTRGRFKVFVIDEVHMLSKQAFNSMLKTFEEPPEHIKFVLATTAPQSIPITVLSRCLQFNLKQMPAALISAHLARVLGEEKLKCEPPALRLIAAAARGSMRDALSLLDQAIAYSAGELTEASVRAMLGTVDDSFLFAIVRALAQGDARAALAVADDMEARNLSFDAALQDLATLLHRVALAQTVPAALSDEDPQKDATLDLAKALQPEEAQLYYQIALHGRQDLPLAPDDYAGFTMSLLRMFAFRPEDGGGGAAIRARAAVSSPLLEDINISGARGILVNVTAGRDLSIGEFEEVGNTVKEYAAEDATVVIGTVIDPDMHNEMRVTVVATGLGVREKRQQPYKIIKTGTGTTDYEQLDTPTVIRNRRVTADLRGTSDGGIEYLDIPAFLRKQAD